MSICSAGATCPSMLGACAGSRLLGTASRLHRFLRSLPNPLLTAVPDGVFAADLLLEIAASGRVGPLAGRSGGHQQATMLVGIERQSSASGKDAAK